MINSILSYVGLASSVTDFADDVVGIVKHANNASNTNRSKAKRRKSCENFIENLVNVAVPVAAGVLAGVFTYSAAAIPAALAAQALVKKSGIGKIAGKLLAPVVEPVFNFFGFVKDKIKKFIGLDVSKWVGKGVDIAEPVVKVSKAIAQSPFVATLANNANYEKREMNSRKRPTLFSGKNRTTKHPYFTRSKATPTFSYNLRNRF